MSDCVFDLQEVSYSYPNQPALHQVSLQIRRGQRVALLGANGSGKSTLLRLLDALCFPTQGRLNAFATPLTEQALADETAHFAFRRRVGLVFQNPDVQLFNPTVFDEVAFGPLQMGWPRQQVLSCVDQALERFGIAHLRQRAPHRLSGGEKKRVALASVLVLDPEVLLLDEPTAALDPASQGEVIRFLSGSRASGRTIVTATHELDLIEDIADYAYVLDSGRLAASGSPAQILADHDLLHRTHLAHAHWHLHGDGLAHLHTHNH
ncbi:MAG: energy-coupling factor ABC transporter ATP-binding protein [Rhodoferax sp.]